MTVARDNLDALTGLRFVAAFTIALGHTYLPWLEITGIGMPLFFTLSGFIIHYVYADLFADNRRLARYEFAVARFSRIYPLYLFLLLYSLLHSPMGPALVTANGAPVLVAFLLGCWTWWPFRVEGHLLTTWYYHISWSVSTELFFYVVYALVLFRLARLRSFRACLVALIVFCGFAYLFFYALFLWRDAWEPLLLQRFPQFVSRNADFDGSLYRWIVYISPYSRIFEFVGGCLTCQLYRLARARPELRARIPAKTLVAVSLALFAVLFAAFRYFGETNPWYAVGNTSPAAFLVSLHMNFLFAPACYLMIFALALGGTALGRALASRVCVGLGDISYSTYLWHPIAPRVLMHAGIEIPAALPYVAAVMALIYAGSWGLYRMVELPAKRMLRRWLTPRRLAPAPTA